MFPSSRAKKVKQLSYVQDHVFHKTVKGFNFLLLGWTDGYSFLPATFNILVSAKEEKRIWTSCVLMDTWFTNKPFIHAVLREGLDVIGMVQDNKQQYRYGEKRETAWPQGFVH